MFCKEAQLAVLMLGYMLSSALGGHRHCLTLDLSQKKMDSKYSQYEKLDPKTSVPNFTLKSIPNMILDLVN